MFDYVDLSAVNNRTKSVENPRRILGAAAPSRARQVVAQGDVLVSTVRPNLNAVAVVPSSLDGATASTGFCVLRPKPGSDSRYLFHWTRSPEFISKMTHAATGASYPAISERIIRGSLIPFPSLSEQRRIASILDRAERLVVQRDRISRCLEELPEAIYVDMFGDPDLAPRSIRLGEIAALQGGRSLVAEDPDAESPYRVLKISAVTSGRYLPWESKPLPHTYIPPASHLVQSGDLLISRANTAELVGAVALVDNQSSNLALPDKIWRFEWHDPRSSPVFYSVLLGLNAIRRRIGSLSSGTGGSMKNISKEKLLGLSLPAVPVDSQLQFAERVEAIPESRTTAMSDLFASVQSRAFEGGL